MKLVSMHFAGSSTELYDEFVGEAMVAPLDSTFIIEKLLFKL